MKKSIFKQSLPYHQTGGIPLLGILFIILLSGIIMAQEKQLAWDLYYSYESFKEKSLEDRRFKHSDIVPLIERLQNKNIFKVEKVGKSIEGRDIYLISLGTGKTKVFLWSQMHGDEPTATAALFDMFNFFSDQNAFSELKKFLLSNLSIYIIPMVNPDGAEIFQRRNIVEIDLNRDVVRLQTPEAQILKNVFDTLKADFGFNLHDQGRDYSVGNSCNPASISFLAPSPNYEKSLTAPRENAMKLIGHTTEILNDFIPGHIAKYTDDYEPRAFGDNFTKWGTGVVLIESGGWRGDREKQFLRKINYVAILSALNSIASGSYSKTDVRVYESIPQNEKFMMDFILKNLKLKREGKDYIIDIGINFEEENIDSARNFCLKASIEDVGDLSVYSGYEEIDLSGFSIEPGKTKPNIFHSITELENLNPADLYDNGYTNVILSDGDFIGEHTYLPFNILINPNVKLNNEIKPDDPANFIIKKDGLVKFVVINGFLVDIGNLDGWSGNSIIINK
jgi:hypothetical protein